MLVSHSYKLYLSEERAVSKKHVYSGSTDPAMSPSFKPIYTFNYSSTRLIDIETVRETGGT